LQIKKRLSFATGYSHRDDWSDVIFSDEKTFPLMHTTSKQYVQIPDGDNPYDPKYTVPKQSHPTQYVHMWACFSANHIGEFELFQQNLDAKLLKSILSRHLLSSARTLFGDQSWWMLHDNDPKYTSGLVQTFLFNNGIQQLEYPPYSPDCNPMENLWSELNRRVENRFAKTLEELKMIIQDEWKKTNVNILSNLVASMPKRCKAIVDNHGHQTKY
jgi:hypothetical protein